MNLNWAIDFVDDLIDVVICSIDLTIAGYIRVWQSVTGRGRASFLDYISVGMIPCSILVTIAMITSLHQNSFKLPAQEYVDSKYAEPGQLAEAQPVAVNYDTQLSEADIWWIVTRSYMDNLMRVEGTHPETSKGGGDPYTVQVGGKHVGGESTGWKHPREQVTVNLKKGTFTSDAYGYVQFLSSTMDSLRRKYTGPDDWYYELPEMHPKNQELAYFWLVHETGSLRTLHQGVHYDPIAKHISVDYSAWKAAVALDNGVWPSLPGGSQSSIPEWRQYTNFVWALWREAGYYRPIIHPLSATPQYISAISSGHVFRYDRPGGRWHKGIDFATPVGTPVLAPENGKIIYVDFQGDGAGHWVAMRPDGFPNLLIKFFHNSEIKVAENDSVKAGDVIALTGSSGAGTGPHLHIEVWIGAESGDGGWIDANRYLNQSKWFAPQASVGGVQ